MDEETQRINEQVRRLLSRRSAKYSRYITETILLYSDEKNSFRLNWEECTIGSSFGKYYQMDSKTQQLIQDTVYKHPSRSGCLNTLILFAAFGITCLVVWVVKGNKKINTVEQQIQKYEQTLQNWNDSIRLARTDGELQRAINRREQAELNLKHFRDSLYLVNGL